MPFEVSTVITIITLLYLTSNCWRSKTERDQCTRNLEKQTKLYKDKEVDSKDECGRLLSKRDERISETKKGRREAIDKMRLCFVASQEKDRKLENKELLVEEKNKEIEQLQKQLEKMKRDFQTFTKKNDDEN